jgi:hypothetical protein
LLFASALYVLWENWAEDRPKFLQPEKSPSSRRAINIILVPWKRFNEGRDGLRRHYANLMDFWRLCAKRYQEICLIINRKFLLREKQFRWNLSSYVHHSVQACKKSLLYAFCCLFLKVKSKAISVTGRGGP